MKLITGAHFWWAFSFFLLACLSSLMCGIYMLGYFIYETPINSTECVAVYICTALISKQQVKLM